MVGPGMLEAMRWRPGARRPWMIPLTWLALALALGLFSPYAATVNRELLNRLPPGFSEDQVLISRAMRRQVLLGLDVGAREAVARESKTLTGVATFQQKHVIAHLRPEASLQQATEEVRRILGDRTVRVFPIRRIVLGDSSLLSIIWGAVLAFMFIRGVIMVVHEPRWWRYRLYEFANLALMALLLTLVFGNVNEALEAADRDGHGLSLSATAIWGLGYLVLLGGALWWWRWDVRTRCRQCVQALGLPLAGGEEGSMLLDTPRVERVCFQGHGALTMDRWHDDWRGYKDMWDAFSRPS